MVDDVARGVVSALHIVLVVNDGCVAGNRLVLIQHEGEHLIGHVDEGDGFFGNFDGLGRHHGYPVTDVTYLVVEAHLVVGRRVGVALATRRITNSLDVPVMKHRMHAGQGPRLRIIDRQDASLGVRAVKHLGVQHAAELNVVRERRLALSQLYRVDLGFRLADHLGLGDLRAGNDARCQRRQALEGDG